MIQRLIHRLLLLPMGLRRKICGVYLLLLAFLSLVPAYFFPPPVTRIPGIDTWMHVAMYGGLGVLLRWAAGPDPLPSAARWLPLGAAGYGLLMEVLQLLFSGGNRMFGWDDAAANLAGAFLFWALAGWIINSHPVQKS